MRIPAPFRRFRVKCHPGFKWEVEVLIFYSAADMDAYRVAFGLKPDICKAYFQSLRVLDFGKGDPEPSRSVIIGEIGFTVPWFQVSIVAHEAAHAALEFMRKIKRRPIRRDEEVFAMAAGEITRQCVLGYKDKKNACGNKARRELKK